MTKLALEAREATPDGAGGQGGSWQVLGTVWGEVTLRSGRLETGPASGISRVSYMIRVRAVGPEQPSRPKPGQRFRTGNRVFLIRTVADAKGGEPYLLCLTDEEILP